VHWLLRALREAGASDAARTLASRAATHASVAGRTVGVLLYALREAGESDAARALAGRAPAIASLDDPLEVSRLLRALREAGASDAARALAGRAAAHTSFYDPADVDQLLRALREAGASVPVTTLLAYATHITLDNHWAVSRLLDALQVSGAQDAARILANRAADAGMFDLFLKLTPAEAASHRYGRNPDGTASPPWTWQEPAS
jgi:hypothetical protein